MKDIKEIDNVEIINKEYLMSDINEEITGGLTRISDLRDKIRDISVNIEYELGMIAANKRMKSILED